jgi:protein ImuB
MAFASIFVPDFPVEAVLRAEPELRSQAVAVLEGKVPLQKVFAGNEKARALGIEPGRTKLQVETCPEVAWRARSVRQEESAHAALLDCAQSFSPRVEDTAPDTLVLDLDGLESLFGPPAKIAREIAQRASQLGLEVNVAVAANPDAAVIAARGFSGVTVIAPGKEAEQLGSLRIEVLFAGMNAATVLPEPERLLDTLEQWGIRSLRALALLPEVALSERLGQAGVRLQQLARGVAQRTIVPCEPPLLFAEAVELEYPVMLLEPLAFLLSRLLEQVCSRLAARALATQELRLELELGNHFQDEQENALPASFRKAASISTRGNCFRRVLRLPVPLIDPKIFLKLLQLDLKAHPPGAPVVGIRLEAEPVRARAAQAGLFQPPTPEPEKLELTLARIAGIVGEEKVGSAELLDTHRAEGFRMQRFTCEAAPSSCRREPGRPSSQPSDRSADRTPPQPAITALRIFRPALLASVTMRDGEPRRIACPKKKMLQGEILWCAGPWRSSGDWWEQDGWARDEWDIAVQEPGGIALYRLVRDLLSGNWIVEGTYD